MRDIIWGTAVRISNRLQESGILSARVRRALRSLGHVFITAPNKRLLNIKFGFKIQTPRGHKGSRSYATGTYEERLGDFLNREIKEKENFLDVGAFIGYYTCLAAQKVGSDGHVWAFEPEEKARTLLHYNVNLNNNTNVTVVASAVGDQDSSISFVDSSDIGVGPAGGFISSAPSENSHIVPVQKLDSIFNSRPDVSIDWIKLDTDGHELQALDGMFSLSQRSPNMKLILEVDPSHFGSSEHMTKLYKKLLALGFKVGLIAERKFEKISLSAPPIMSEHNLNIIFIKTD